jgi:hypothetical protein
MAGAGSGHLVRVGRRQSSGRGGRSSWSRGGRAATAAGGLPTPLALSARASPFLAGAIRRRGRALSRSKGGGRVEIPRRSIPLLPVAGGSLQARRGERERHPSSSSSPASTAASSSLPGHRQRRSGAPALEIHGKIPVLLSPTAAPSACPPSPSPVMVGVGRRLPGPDTRRPRASRPAHPRRCGSTGSPSSTPLPRPLHSHRPREATTPGDARRVPRNCWKPSFFPCLPVSLFRSKQVICRCGCTSLLETVLGQSQRRVL